MHQRVEWPLFNKVCILCYKSGWVLPPHHEGSPIVLVSTLEAWILGTEMRNNLRNSRPQKCREMVTQSTVPQQ